MLISSNYRNMSLRFACRFQSNSYRLSSVCEPLLPSVVFRQKFSDDKFHLTGIFCSSIIVCRNKPETLKTRKLKRNFDILLEGMFKQLIFRLLNEDLFLRIFAFCKAFSVKKNKKCDLK